MESSTRDPSQSGRHVERMTPDFSKIVPALVILWYGEDPERVGEVALVPAENPENELVFGRSDLTGSTQRCLRFCQQRPGFDHLRPVLEDGYISREQFKVLHSQSGSLTITNVGRRRMFINEAEVYKQMPKLLHDDDVIELEGRLLLLVTQRPKRITAYPEFEVDSGHKFGRADRFSLAGESPLAWQLRSDVRSAALGSGHILILGDTGVGKEIAVAAVHGNSDRSNEPLVTCQINGVTPNLFECEMFGNKKNFPQVGMKEKQGFFGLANRTWLYFSEVGELSWELQGKLLACLDTGHYKSLGHDLVNFSDFRCIAATNRKESELKPDFRSRFTTTIRIPTFRDRICDVPLITQALIMNLAKHSALSLRRFESARHPGRFNVDISLIKHLMKEVMKVGSWRNGRGMIEVLNSAIRHSVGNCISWSACDRAENDARVTSVPRTSAVDPAVKLEFLNDIENNLVNLLHRHQFQMAHLLDDASWNLGKPRTHELWRIVQSKALLHANWNLDETTKQLCLPTLGVAFETVYATVYQTLGTIHNDILTTDLNVLEQRYKQRYHGSFDSIWRVVQALCNGQISAGALPSSCSSEDISD